MSSTTGSGPGGGLPAGSTKRDNESTFRAKTNETISDLGGAAKQAADTLVSAATDKLKDIANQQVVAGADLVGHVGASVRVAGEHLHANAPNLARCAFSAAQPINNQRISSAISRSKASREARQILRESARRSCSAWQRWAASCSSDC